MSKGEDVKFEAHQLRFCQWFFLSEMLLKKPSGFAQPIAVLTLGGTDSQVRWAANMFTPVTLSQLKMQWNNHQIKDS